MRFDSPRSKRIGIRHPEVLRRIWRSRGRARCFGVPQHDIAISPRTVATYGKQRLIKTKSAATDEVAADRFITDSEGAYDSSFFFASSGMVTLVLPTSEIWTLVV